ncbi:MAG: 3-methyladenine DNA glycosylase AlkC [Planctomycetota bacterium]|jgi:3-methyladenine DNA glycosylase AlkC
MTTSFTPLKFGYDKAYIERIADGVSQQWPPFPHSEFCKAVLGEGWDQLELKARMKRISACLDERLPTDLPAFLGAIEHVAPHFPSFLGMLFPDLVELRVGRDFQRHWDLGAGALARFTKYSSSEFAVRPMIVEDQQRMLAQMQEWATSDCEHLRRLASEGCRPRLPWAMALPELKRDPSPLLPILESLRDDESEYVRRSVANNLNDVAKDHPDVVLGVAERWLEEAPSCASPKHRRRMVKHACRTLLKAGDGRAMALFGFRDPRGLSIRDLKLDRAKIKLGDTLGFDLTISSKDPIGLVRVEYAVHYQKANGSLSPKVFKISEFDCAETNRTVRRRHHFRDLSTRRHHAGPHRIEIRLNGTPKAHADFDLSR